MTALYRNARFSSHASMTAVLAVLLTAGWTGSTSAQDALGSGDALDANLNTAGSRNAPVPDDSLAYRVRNLLVTGNVAGGRGFRGSVGYTAADDFRDSLGSDDLYRFRAESAYSAPSFVLYRDQLTDLQIGQDLRTLEFRRATTGDSMSDIVNRDQPTFDPQLRNVQLRLDRLVSDVSISQDIARASESEPLGVTRDEEGRLMVPLATSLIGLDSSPLPYVERTAGMSVLDRSRLTEDLVRQRREGEDPRTNQIGLPFQSSFAKSLTVDNRVATGQMDSRVQTQDTTYDDILKSVAERYTDGDPLDEESATELDKRYGDLREYLKSFEEDPDATTPSTDGRQPGASDTGLEVTLPTMDDGADGEDTTGDVPAVPNIPQTPDVLPTLESFGIALRHGQTVRTYASGDEDRFNELVRSAEEDLSTGEYFWAERRFTRALRFSPMHPLASAGKAHAQLGAGLYLPAALSLRQVLTQYPELIDVKYDRRILPTTVRLNQNVQAIRERLDQGADPAMMGFLLAYIGHQTDDRDLIDRGLSAMEDADARDRLLLLLQAIWQGDGESNSGADSE